jgi:hypothetical protein
MATRMPALRNRASGGRLPESRRVVRDAEPVAVPGEPRQGLGAGIHAEKCAVDDDAPRAVGEL